MTVKVGDRVKVEFEAEVISAYDDEDGILVELETSNKNDQGWFSADKFTVIQPPIVLPTKKNALVALNVNGWILRRTTAHDWISANGNYLKNAEVLAVVSANPAGYRVIFEGEDD